MSLDGKLLARARERLVAVKEDRAALRTRREEEIYAAIPRVRQIDSELRALLSQVVSASLKNAGEARVILDRAEKQSLELCAEKAELLVSRGYPDDYLENVGACPKCGDSGYTPDGKMCSCLRALYEEERAKELSSLLKLGEESFAGFDLSYYTGRDREAMEMVLDICRRYALRFGPDSPNLLFRGDTGLGKTFLSGCIARVVSGQGFSVVYETASEAFAAFEDQKFSRSADTYEAASDRVRRILDCELLILDDLGTEMTTAFTQSALYTIVNSRLTGGKKTIVSTNLSPAELEKRYTPQIVSRLTGEYDTLLFRGRDIRAIRKERRYT